MLCNLLWNQNLQTFCPFSYVIIFLEHLSFSSKSWKIYDHIFSKERVRCCHIISEERIFLDLFAIIEKLYVWMIYWHHIKEKSRPRIKSNIFTNKVDTRKDKAEEKLLATSTRNVRTWSKFSFMVSSDFVTFFLAQSRLIFNFFYGIFRCKALSRS